MYMGFAPYATLQGAVGRAGVVAIAVSLSLLSPPGSAAAADVVTLPGPASVLTLGIFAGSNDDDLKGVVCQSPNTCEAVIYPSWLAYTAGVDPLNTDLHQTPGLKVVYGYSQGGQVITAWMRTYAAAEDAPPAEELVFVIIANGDRAHGGANTNLSHVMPETQYQVIDIARQYDYGADMPDDRSNLLAMANARAGLRYIHMDYEEVDIYDPANIVWTEGNTTYVFVPTENLPLLEPLRKFGLDELADKLNGPLKEKIERGYNRDYLPTPESRSASSTSFGSTEPAGPAESTQPAVGTTAAPDEDQVDVVRAGTHRLTIPTPASTSGDATPRTRIERSRDGLTRLGRPTDPPVSAGVHEADDRESQPTQLRNRRADAADGGRPTAADHRAPRSSREVNG